MNFASLNLKGALSHRERGKCNADCIPFSAAQDKITLEIKRAKFMQNDQLADTFLVHIFFKTQSLISSNYNLLLNVVYMSSLMRI